MISMLVEINRKSQKKVIVIVVEISDRMDAANVSLRLKTKKTLKVKQKMKKS